MDEVAAANLAVWLGAGYPGRNVQEEHIKAWAEWIRDWPDEGDARIAVEELRASLSDPPSIAELTQLAELRALERSGGREYRFGIQGARMAKELPAAGGVTFAEFLESRPDLRAVIEKMRRVTDLEEQEREEIAETRAAIKALAELRHPGACSGSGKPVAEIAGKRVCPDCGAPVPDIEIRLPKKHGLT